MNNEDDLQPGASACPELPSTEADLDALWGYPPGYLNAAQWILLGESSPSEMLAAMKALESQLAQDVGNVSVAPAGPVAVASLWPADLAPARPIVRRSIRRGLGGRIRVVAGGRGHA